MASGRPLPNGFVILPYTPDMSPAIVAIDRECPISLSPEYPFRYVKIARIYFTAYHKRVQQFKDSLTIVAQEEKTGKTVGFVSGALKHAYYDNKQTGVGYIFDLRVHDDFGRRGIGRNLVVEMERKLQERGAELLYAIVYSLNFQAEMLFSTNLGYRIGTKKTLHIESAISTSPTQPEFGLQKVSPEDAKRELETFHGDRDMSLVDYSDLFSAAEYMGSYFVQDKEGNKAAASLWNATACSGKTVIAAYFPAEKLVQRSFYLPLCLCVIALYVFGFLTSLWIYDIIPEQMLKLLFASVILFIAFLIFELVGVMFQYWRIIRKQPQGEKKVTLFGLHFIGNKDMREVLYGDLLEGVKRLLKGVDLICYHVDNNDPDAHCFDAKVHELMFLHKKPGSEYWNSWTRNLFYDPRDLA